MEKYRYLGANLSLDIMKDEDLKTMAKLCSALGNEKRLEILRELQVPPYYISVPEMAKKTNIPISTLMHHLNIMEDACLIYISYKNSSTNSIRMIKRDLQSAELKVYLKKTSHKNDELEYNKQEMKVGCFTNYYGNDFSFVTDEKSYNFLGANCFVPERFDAQLVYSSFGQIEYYFDNKIAKDKTVKKINLSLELCSEFAYYNNTHKSDITFWINDVEILTYISDGDYGDRRGLLNPSWWDNNNTQYGKLINIKVNEKGVYLNGVFINDKVNLSSLKLQEGNKISIRLGNKKTAINPGGFNIFGKRFGDFPQDIVLETYYI